MCVIQQRMKLLFWIMNMTSSQSREKAIKPCGRTVVLGIHYKEEAALPKFQRPTIKAMMGFLNAAT